MKRELKRLGSMGLFGMSVLLGPGLALASEAVTSAQAGGRPGQDTSAASAHYQGDRGWAHTDARSGEFGLADGVAVGVDANGFSVSVSDAVSVGGQAVAGGFSLSADRSGQVSTSSGFSASGGQSQRSAGASASTSTATHNHAATAMSGATANSDPGGYARASTQSAPGPAQPSHFHGAMGLNSEASRPRFQRWGR